MRNKRRRLRDLEIELTEEEEAEFLGPFIVEGYIGKPKGSRIHVWYRGRWQKGLTHEQCCAILMVQPDFKQETSRLEKWWIGKGHGAQKTIKSTPECVEAEYDWGKSKYEFRNHINTRSTRVDVYRAAVMRSLGRHAYTSRTGQPRPPPLPRRRHWRFIRRANDYLRAYSLFKTPLALQTVAEASNTTLFALIERTRRQFKSHRCVGEQEFKFTSVDDPDDQLSPEDDLHCERYLIKDRSPFDLGKAISTYLNSLCE